MDLAALAAREHPIGADPREVLVVGEIVDPQPTVEFELGDDLVSER